MDYRIKERKILLDETGVAVFLRDHNLYPIQFPNGGGARQTTRNSFP